MNGGLAFVTPTHRGDLSLCADLNHTLLELTADATHYILPDRRDLPFFVQLAGPRTVVVAKEDWLPAGYRRLPRVNRWTYGHLSRPVSGWLIQQIVKLAAAFVLSEEVIVTVDSDVLLVRELTDDDYLRDGSVRLFRRPGGIRPDMSRHVEWHRNACALLGVIADEPPLADFISPTVSWSPPLVRSACERVEAVSGRPWHAQISRTPQFSECLLYGAFVTKVLDGSAPVWIDEDERCLNWWEERPLGLSESGDFSAGFGPEDTAVMISSHSGTPTVVRRTIASSLSGARLWPELSDPH